MHQRISFPAVFLIICSLVSCGGKKNPSKQTPEVAKDSNTVEQNQIDKNRSNNTEIPLLSLQPQIDKGLDKWVHSFKNFHIDSFRQSEKREFQTVDHDVDDMSKFYGLYKPALYFSPDSSYFIDLYSSGVFLEKKGKKIIASADVDQGVTLYNTKTKDWKRIISFGPSAGIEEALWVSPTQFILAGTVQNDDGEHQPILLLGDAEGKSFRWFEASFTRDKSAKYEASGFSKLKIDEWE